MFVSHKKQARGVCVKTVSGQSARNCNGLLLVSAKQGFFVDCIGKKFPGEDI